VVVDTDGGIDDCAALWYLLTCPRVDVLGVSVTYGNVSSHQAAQNVAKVLEAAGRTQIPVIVGATAPMGPAPVAPGASWVHGQDGLGDCHSWLASQVRPFEGKVGDLVREVGASSRGEIDLLCLGPLTNLAEALLGDPDLVTAVGQVVVMGGAIAECGNATPVAEANVAHDPRAAAAVIAAQWSTPGRLVTLDATHEATLGPGELALLEEARSPLVRFLAGPLRFYSERASGLTGGPASFPCHDLLAAAALVEPSILRWSDLPLEVDCAGGPAWAATVADRRLLRPGWSSRAPSREGFRTWRVALGADQAAFRAVVREMLSS
jgi:purine nucleosidase